jgi:hypothetical protein
MANARRGEIDAVLGGASFRLCLTLGALAEIEAAFGAKGLMALSERLGSGDLSARDLVAIIGAAARGGGSPATDEEIAALPVAGGLEPFVQTVAALIAVTFGDAEPVREGGPRPFVNPNPLPGMT